MKKIFLILPILLAGCAVQTPATDAVINSTQAQIDSIQHQVSTLPKECNPDGLNSQLSAVKTTLANVKQSCQADVKTATVVVKRQRDWLFFIAVGETLFLLILTYLKLKTKGIL